MYLVVVRRSIRPFIAATGALVGLLLLSGYNAWLFDSTSVFAAPGADFVEALRTRPMDSHLRGLWLSLVDLEKGLLILSPILGLAWWD